MNKVKVAIGLVALVSLLSAWTLKGFLRWVI